MFKKLAFQRIAMILTVFLLVTLVVSACSSEGSSNSGDSGDGNPSEKKVELTLWIWDGTGMEKTVAEFNNSHPNIQIKLVQLDGFQLLEKLKTNVSAGSGAPDISIGYVDQYLPYADKFYDFNEFGAKDLKDQYLEWKWQAGTSKDGKLIGFPIDNGPAGVFYRKDLFEKAGLPGEPNEVAQTIKTWDDFMEAGKKLKDATGIPMSGNLADLWRSIAGQADTGYFDSDDKLVLDTNPQFKRAWDYVAKAKQLGIYGKYDEWSTEWNTALNKGGFATLLSGSWMKGIFEASAPDGNGLWRVAPIPEGATKSIGGSWLLAPKQGKHGKEAFEAIQWLAAPERQLEVYKQTGGFPSTPSVYNDPAIVGEAAYFGGQKIGEIFAESAKKIKPLYTSPDEATVQPIIDKYIGDLMRTDMDPNEAWDKMIKEVHTALERK